MGKISAAARIRENQRRCRARRKEYIESLENRIREYEKNTTKATIEIQQAARGVADENSKLRTLLAYHGVSVDEVNDFLRLDQEGSSLFEGATVGGIMNDTSMLLERLLGPEKASEDLATSPHGTSRKGLWPRLVPRNRGVGGSNASSCKFTTPNASL